MPTIADRYARLSRAYVQLSERFHKLDVEHMTLKSKLLPLLKTVKSWKQTIATLKQDKTDLEAQLQTLSAKYEELRVFELLLEAAAQADLIEAEEQVKLVEQTIQEFEADADPDLSETEKQLLLEYETESASFLSVESNGYHAVAPTLSDIGDLSAEPASLT
ncbi:hypothetical protein H6G89_17895 [Oscillatoria sp. FACHB-1407]|uniref:hypothetical protein n=1 Tax=Oscillatoria sp. FACHB-1407 TaxID=2692847 RepID=UPI0016880FA9|nr:hypothetical protein [Oscillatoria sp. FACHB-1407]MBD2462916.1 hypothetical protein [Oscillatoria sp. FACHB-1407]